MRGQGPGIDERQFTASCGIVRDYLSRRVRSSNAGDKSVLEIAKEKGMRIGLVTNSTIYDASPAALVP
ncbi:MAG: alkaline phosphatase [Candidatus Binatia bacterium]